MSEGRKDEEELIKEARTYFRLLQQGKDTADTLIPLLSSRLRQAGATVAALDPTGKKSRDQMKIELDRHARLNAVKKGRRRYRMSQGINT